MRNFSIILCLMALCLTGYSALTYKAPQIEADIERRAAQALSDISGDGVKVMADGRDIILEGVVPDEEQRQRMLSAAATVPGIRSPIDNLKGQAIVSPYRFNAVKDKEGKVTIKGLAPTVELKTAIESDARAIFGNESVVEIEVAAGSPSSDWQAVTGSALDALATMRHGRLSISDANVQLDGEVASGADVRAIDLFAEMMPEGFTWTHDVSIYRNRATPFTFSVVKDLEGGLSLTGFAPDEETRAALIEEGKAIGGDKPVIADIQVADGMPDDEWPSLVQAGISAMKEMEAGRFDVVDNDVSFSSDPLSVAGETTVEGVGVGAKKNQQAMSTSKADVSAVDVPTDDNPAISVAETSAKAQEPKPVLTVDKVEQGVWSVRGIVPDQQSQEALVSVVKDHAGGEQIEVELDLAGGGSDDDWLQFATDRIRSLDEVSAGRLNLEDFEAHLIGVVETPDDIAPVQAALSAIDKTMTVDLQPIDPRPKASLDLKLSPNSGIILAGALPGGLNEQEALSALGIQDYDGELLEDGRGSADVWRRDLTHVGALLPAFEQIDVSIGGDRPSVEGQIHLHADADEITEELALAFGDERQPTIDIVTTATIYDDETKRTNPLTGEEEVYRQGYWLPAIEIVASEEACREHSSDMLEADKITFLRGEGTLDSRAERTLNALAALAIQCLEKSDLVLEIGGHTDSRGARKMNQELSQARADVVLRALTARGVDIASLRAVGYGDARPVADNATDEGRAANRRITFEWKASVDAQFSGARG